MPQRIKRLARSWLQNRYSGKVRLPRALITKRLTCGFRDERYFGLRLLCPERLPHHSHVRCPHRIVYFCTSLLTLYSPTCAHRVFLLLRWSGRVVRRRIFSAKLCQTPKSRWRPRCVCVPVVVDVSPQQLIAKKKTLVCPSFISTPCPIPA